MTLSFMQLVDYWIGVPLCFLLSMWDRLMRAVRGPGLKQPKNILFIELSEMGSAILAYSSLEHCKQMFPGSKLYFLIFKRNRESVELLEVIPKDQIVDIDDRNFLRFFVSTIAALIKLRRLSIDTVLDLELFSRCTAILGYLSGASNRVGFFNFTDEGLYRGTFLTHKVLYNNLQHISHNFLSLVLALKDDPTELPMLKQDVSKFVRPLPCKTPDEGEQRTIQALLEEADPALRSPKKLVLFAPDPGLLTLRGWAIENYVALARRIQERFPEHYIAVIGLPQSKSFARTMQQQLPNRVIDLTGKTKSLREAVVLIHLSQAIVSTDGGLSHLAALTQTHNLVLFGPETPVRYAPLGGKVTTFFSNYACSPCFSAANHRRSVCTNNRCMQAITVDTIFDAVAACL